MSGKQSKYSYILYNLVKSMHVSASAGVKICLANLAKDQHFLSKHFFKYP